MRRFLRCARASFRTGSTGILAILLLAGARGPASGNVCGVGAAGGSLYVVCDDDDNDVVVDQPLSRVVEGSVQHTSASGFDSFAFESGVEVGGSVRIEHGSGGSETVLEETEIGGELKLAANGGEDVVELTEVEVGGRTSLSVGGSADAVGLEDSAFGSSFTAEGGSGTDCFEDRGGNTFQGAFRTSGFEGCAP
jgi:hypothetical protein